MGTVASEFIDLGCGFRKAEGYFGVDCHPFPGVDKVFDFDSGAWPLESDRFEKLRCIHVIEHISDTRNFLKEIHRICKNGAEVYFETPHFSWIDSWADPTHRWHFASSWYGPLTKGEYLSQVVGEFELVKSVIEFGPSARSWLPRLIVALFGQATYERYYAFRYPARNVHTTLRVVKR